MRIIFAGTPDFSASVLKGLVASEHDIVAVYTQPDRRAGRGKKLLPPPVKVIAEEHHIPVYQPVSLKDPEQHSLLDSHQADVMVVVAYGLLLPQAVLDIPKMGCINIHASLLPRWRGAAPIERAIEAGDTETGITMMKMDAGLDTGDMILVAKCPITSGVTGDALRESLKPLALDATLKTLNMIAGGSAIYTPQSEEGANYASKLTKHEAFLDWSLSASQFSQRIAAFNSSNVCFAVLANGERVRIWQAKALDETSNYASGTIVRADDNAIVVACQQGSLAIETLQLAGGKILSCKDILNSRRDWFKPGDSLMLELPA